MSEAMELSGKLKTEGEKITSFFGELHEEQWRTEV